MASTELLPSGRYRGVYYLPPERPGEKPRKRRVPGTFAHKKAARDAAIEAEGEGIADPQRDPARGRIAWGAWETLWAPSRDYSPKQAVRVDGLIRNYLTLRWGDVPLVEITNLDVQTWVNELRQRPSEKNGHRGKSLSASSARACYYVLSASLKAAKRAGYLAANVCTGVNLPTLPTAPERFLTDAEIEKLFHHFDGRHLVLVELLVETGLRFGELAGLHWERIDWERGSVRVAEQWDDDAGEAGEMRPTKGKRARSIPLTAPLRKVLEDWSAKSPHGSSCGQVHEGPACRSSLVIPNTVGGPLDGSNFHDRQWSSAVRASGIGHCRIHDLRHTWASRLVTEGASLSLLQAWGGWESYAMVQRYAHLQDDGADIFREALGRRQRGKSLAAPESASEGRHLRAVK